MKNLKAANPRTIFKKIEIHGVKEYLFIGVLIILLGLFFNLDFAIIFMLMYFMVPVMSICSAYITGNHLTYTVHFKHHILEKGEQSVMTLTLSNNTILPVPEASFCLEEHAHLRYEGEHRLQASLEGNGVISFSKNFTACIWGQAKAGISSCSVTDLFGFVTFYMDPGTIHQTSKATLTIVPHIPDLPDNKTILDWCMNSEHEDEEEERQVSTHYSTLPGYEYRDYQPGDSLKNINWKLSQKRDHYMVRLPEQESYASPLLWLDCCIKSDSATENTVKLHLFDGQKILEGYLGVIKSFLFHNISCTALYYLNEEWQEMHLRSPEDIGMLQMELALFEFSEHDAAYSYPASIFKSLCKSGSVFAFTVLMHNSLHTLCEQIECNYGPVMSIAAEEGSLLRSNSLLLLQNMEFQRL